MRLLDSGANALFLAATRHGRIDVAAVLSSLYPASTVITARVLLKERISAMQNAGIVGALVSGAFVSARARPIPELLSGNGWSTPLNPEASKGAVFRMEVRTKNGGPYSCRKMLSREL